MKAKWCLAPILLIISAAVSAQDLGLTGSLQWDKMEIQAVVSLNLASAGIRLPAGRTRGEAIINSEYLGLIRPNILKIQADSSSILDDLVQRGELKLSQIDDFVLNAAATPPYISPDTLNLQTSYKINMQDISSALIRHNNPADIRRILNPGSVQAYTGIIIIASSPLPQHGMKSTASVKPCLFPKIWDTGNNLVYERNMLEKGRKTAASYAPASGIFSAAPSGLSPEVAALAGQKPLRIIARGVFGDTPTDLIIDSQDALQIISSEENRRLLREGRVIIIIDDAALKTEFGD